jgi:hypothetical protein
MVLVDLTSSKRHYINIPYVTILNVRIPKLVRIPNIYTNPELNPEAKLG